MHPQTPIPPWELRLAPQAAPDNWTSLKGTVQAVDKTAKTVQIKDDSGNIVQVPVDKQVSIQKEDGSECEALFKSRWAMSLPWRKSQPQLPPRLTNSVIYRPFTHNDLCPMQRSVGCVSGVSGLLTAPTVFAINKGSRDDIDVPRKRAGTFFYICAQEADHVPIQKLDPELVRYINLKLAALGEPTNRATVDPSFLEMTGPLLRNHHQKDEQLGWPLCAADARIQAFLDETLKDGLS